MSFNEAERQRVEAELARVEAEKQRVNAEQNEGSGRVEAEERRVTAELLREAARLEIKKYVRKAVGGYLVLAAACIIGIFAVSNKSQDDLTDRINQFAKASCLASRQPDSSINRYNDLVQTQIDANKEARDINLNRNDLQRAKLNNETIERLKSDRIPLPTLEKCNTPIIK